MLTHWREPAESIFLQKLLWEEGQVCFTIEPGGRTLARLVD